MRSHVLLRLSTALVALLYPAISLEDVDHCAAETFSYRCHSAAIEKRAEDLLERLSLAEVIQQTWALDRTRPGNTDELLGKIGSFGIGQLAVGAAMNPNMDIAGRVNARNALQSKVIAASPHGIPASWFGESLHSAVAGGTVFPELVTQGATWDVELIMEIGAALASEATAVGIDTAFSPVLNMWVDPRFGRLQEGYSENPTLTAAYAAAMVKGLQGEQQQGKWSYFNKSKLVAVGKHYAAYGAALGGLNGAPAELSERTLREWYLAPWRAFARAGGKAVMTSHNAVLNQPMHANDYVTNRILRSEFGFGEGLVISDCNDIPGLVNFRVAANLSHAAAKGIRGGVDLDLQCQEMSGYTHLSAALDEGLVTLAEVKHAARRVLQSKFALGLFDQPMTDASKAHAALNTREHQDLALRAAEEGIVLLKNDGNALPVKTSYKKLAVIGASGGCSGFEKHCGARSWMLGSYSQYTGTVEVLTVAEALKASVGNDTKVDWLQGASPQPQSPKVAAKNRQDAVALAEASDAVVVVLGDDLSTAAEWGDRDNLDLPGDQLPLLSALVETRKPIVLVLITGRTVTFGPRNSLLNNVTSVLSAFRPGQMGGVAIANLLTGKSNPSGKLAQNWVRNVGQVMSGASPWLQWRVGKWDANNRSKRDPDGRVYDPYRGSPSTPLFHFGFGLSYTTFLMDSLQVAVQEKPHAVLSVSVEVKNSGAVTGTEVVQVYCLDPVMEFVRPWKRLISFTRVTLAAGESRVVQIDVSPAELAFQDDSSAAGAWRVVPGDYQIRVGPSSVEDLLVKTVTVQESWKPEEMVI